MAYTVERARELWRKYSKTPKGKYQYQKSGAKKRGIPWEISFEEWWEFWKDSWELRGNYNLVMARKGDVGPYSKDNIYLTTHGQNMKDAWVNGIYKDRPKNIRDTNGRFLRKVGT